MTETDHRQGTLELLKRAFNRILMPETTLTTPPSRGTPGECRAACQTTRPSTTSPPPVKAIVKTDAADRPVTQPAVQRSCPCLIDGLSPFGCFVFPRCRQKFKAFLADRKLRENNLMDHFGKCSTTGFSKFRKRIRNERGYETAWKRHVTNWTICNKNRENVTQPTRKRKWTHINKMGHHA